MVNLLPFGATPLSVGRILVIHKKLKIVSEGRLLSYREALKSGAAMFFTSEQYTNSGLEVINNSPEEILEAVREAWLRSRGEWQESEEDRVLQEQARSIFEAWDKKYNCFRVRIGSAFLRTNPELLA